MRAYIAAALMLFSGLIAFDFWFMNISYADQTKKPGATAGAIASEPKVCRAHGTVTPIPDEIWNRMQGVSWHAGMGCPARDQLRYLRVPYLDFKQRPKMGGMIVARSVAEDILSAFNEIYCSRNFMIDKLSLINQYGGSDPRSMDANNTSGFNCRLTSSGNRLSEHSFGVAIDINPVQNPYVNKGTTLPKGGQPYDTVQERAQALRGMIIAGGVVTRAFARINWKWGGDWLHSKDYQHFSSTGR